MCILRIWPSAKLSTDVCLFNPHLSLMGFIAPITPLPSSYPVDIGRRYLREVKNLAQGHTASGLLGLELGRPNSRTPIFDCSVCTAFRQPWTIQVEGEGEAEQPQSCFKASVGGPCLQNHARVSAWFSRFSPVVLCSCFVLARWPHWTVSPSPSPPRTFMFRLRILSHVARLPCCLCWMQFPTFKAWHLPETPFSDLHHRSWLLPPLHFHSIWFILSTVW